MLTNISQDAALCYQRAVDCAERSGTCANVGMRAFYLEREKAWLTLARIYECTERLNLKLDRRLGQVRSKKFRDWPGTNCIRNCPSCKIETNVSSFGFVMCPNCQRVVDQVV